MVDEGISRRRPSRNRAQPESSFRNRGQNPVNMAKLGGSGVLRWPFSKANRPSWRFQSPNLRSAETIRLHQWRHGVRLAIRWVNGQNPVQIVMDIRHDWRNYPRADSSTSMRSSSTANILEFMQLRRRNNGRWATAHRSPCRGLSNGTLRVAVSHRLLSCVFRNVTVEQQTCNSF